VFVVTDPSVIETSGLTKHYEDVEALRGLDLQVPAGSIFGFLGTNGAGKTTTIKVLLGMARPSGGDARVFGQRPSDVSGGMEIRKRAAFVSDDKDLYDYMTVGEMTAFTKSFYPKWRADLEQQYLRKFDLAQGRKIKELSRGMRTKLAMLLALCRDAELLILDEPTSGLDPAMAEEMLQALVSYVANNASTVFFSSHQLTEVEQIADHVAIIDRGQTIVAGALDDLRSQYRRIQLVFEQDAPQFKVHAPGMHRIRREGRVITILSGPPKGGPSQENRERSQENRERSPGNSTSDAVIEELRGYRPASLDVSPVTLKDIFLESVRTED
jgi:ABC-2 type transport system ATP-binding protein